MEMSLSLSPRFDTERSYTYARIASAIIVALVTILYDNIIVCFHVVGSFTTWSTVRIFSRR